MPTYYLPRNRGVHRVAAIALYRALITKCKTAPVVDTQRVELRNVIRNQYRRNVLVTGVTRLTTAFKAGYQALHVLGTAQKDVATSGNNAIESFLTKVKPILKVPAPEGARYATQAALRQEKQQHEKATTPHESSRTASPLAILSRKPAPLSELNGRRKVPILVAASRIPILRIKKPQPESLSRYIRQRIAVKQKRIDLGDRLNESMLFAHWEDAWEQLQPSTDTNDGSNRIQKTRVRNDRISWTVEVRKALNVVNDRVVEEHRKHAYVAARMTEIVDRERALADEEESQRQTMRKAQNRRARLERVRGRIALAKGE